MAISPDGRLIAYIANSESKTAIWIRPIGTLTAHVLAGTENADDVFWSPDARYVGFRADQILKKIDVTGGPPTVLGPASAATGPGGTWNRDGVILFSGGELGRTGIVRISSSGGNITRLTTSQSGKEFGHYVPQFLPDGNHFVYHAFALDSPPTLMSYVTSLDSKEPARLLMRMEADRTGTRPPRFVAPGYWVFLRNGILMVQSFDLKRLELTGEPVAVAENVSSFAASDNGVLIYAKRVNTSQQPLAQQLQWFDRKGNVTGKVASPGDLGGPRLSPDGRHLAFFLMTAGNTDTWVVDLDRGVANRLTFAPGIDAWPLWEPDGSHIVFATSREGGALPNKLFRKSASGVGTEEKLYAGPAEEALVARDVSSDGRYVIFDNTNLNNLIFDVLAMPLSGDKKPFTYLHSSFNNTQPQFSPDGRWVAYSTNESGSYQIVVRTFPDPNGGRWQVTANGGMEPRWRRDGRELYYVALDGKLMAVPIRPGSAFQADQATPLFQTPLTFPTFTPFPIRYDVTADGQRFLMSVSANTPESSAPAALTNPTPIVAIVNWTAAFQKK
jgi:Tol biopolymer transport system component